jgi:taurine dioxygenase
MTCAAIQVTPITPRLGAEISNIDLTAALSNQQVDELHTALAEHQVLFFRDQRINLEQQKTLGRHFGELHIHPNIPGPEGHPEILPIHADANSKRIAGENWHSDVSCDAEPPLGSILYLHTVPPVGGDTIFASQHSAYEALTPAFKTFLDGLTATHSGDRSYRRTNRLLGIDDRHRVFPQAVHPVVRTHPVTKRKALFVNQGFTLNINELSEEESRSVLDFLYAHSTKRRSRCGSGGSRTRLPSGTTARCSTSRCGTTSRKCVRATASPSRAIARIDRTQQWVIPSPLPSGNMPRQASSASTRNQDRIDLGIFETLGDERLFNHPKTNFQIARRVHGREVLRRLSTEAPSTGNAWPTGYCTPVRRSLVGRRSFSRSCIYI